MYCGYDGGDCCGCNVNLQYCQGDCGCNDPNANSDGTTCPPATTTTTIAPTTGSGGTGYQNDLYHGSFIIWFIIVSYCLQDLIFALDARPDLIFESAIQPAFSALKQTDLTCGRPYYKRAMG